MENRLLTVATTTTHFTICLPNSVITLSEALLIQRRGGGYSFKFIKNVSTSTSYKKTPTSVQEFKESLPNTFIYESILIKIYVNANIMIMQTFHLIKYDLNGH